MNKVTHTAVLAVTLASLLLLCLVPAAAQEVTVDSTALFCFSAEDFTALAEDDGVFILSVPNPSVATVRYGSRAIRAGDALPKEALGQLTLDTHCQTKQDVSISYYTVSDGNVTAAKELKLSILPAKNEPPTAQNGKLETYKNIANTGTLQASDPEGRPLTYNLVKEPKRGTVAIAEDGTFTYTPKKNKVGVDSFVYTAADPAGKVSREATVTITILKPADETQYTDTAGKDCRFAAEWMRQTGIFTGETVGENPCFSPERQVTRGEFVTMLVKALDIPVDEEVTQTGYADEVPQWLQPYLAAAVRWGLTEGLENQQVFEADTPITAAEADVLLKNALNREESCISPEELPMTRAQAACALYDAAMEQKSQGINEIL